MSRREMRWYGWGYADTTYSMEKRPFAWPYLKETLVLTDETRTPPVNPETIQLRPSRLDEATLAALRQIVGAEAVVTADAVRRAHSLGKSYRDLIQLRQGQVPNPTDAVIFPDNEDEILKVLALANENGVAVIPFGGGTSVVGGVEPMGTRPAFTVSLARLNRVLSIDEMSQTVTAEAGILGPALEAALNQCGLTLNHFPQSFEFSTLGGWIATRSAGQASTKYGKIEDMVVGARMVTPCGWVETPTVPARATGPSLLQLLTGSEGVFGIITQATLRVQPVPKFQQEAGWLFRDFHAAVEALRAIMQTGLTPALARLSDEAETRTTFHMREGQTGWTSLKQKFGLAALARAGHSFERGALLLLRFEGDDECALHEAQHAQTICKKQGAFNLGASPVRSWVRDRFHTPYLRDVLLDRGILVDTLETATEWKNVEALHGRINSIVSQTIAATGSKALTLTHLSHVYRDGASLYVTFLARSTRGRELEQWHQIKTAATDGIMNYGGALSHHHGVGYDHAKWLGQAEGQTGLEILHAVKRALDPQGVMNPCKLLTEVMPVPAPSNAHATEIIVT
ncbi:MAG: FAD-binding oxidoreductase [Anaerolineales bacterium]